MEPDIVGTDGNDKLVGTGASEAIVGLDGNDTIEGKGGADEMQGGPGNDTVSYAHSPEAVFVPLADDGSLDFPSGGHADGDTGFDFENITGSDFEDTLIGNNSGNTLKGGRGGDSLYGDANDLNDGGDDRLFGGSGGDNLLGYGGEDLLDGGSGSDLISYAGSLGVAITLGKKGKETIGVGGDASGDRIRNIESVNGSDFVDAITGNERRNFLVGFDGNDTLKGGAGDDFLAGSDDDDAMYGGSGKDDLFGGLGSDTMSGGKGKDTFWFTEALGPTNIDEIVDFSPNDDGMVLRREQDGPIFYNLPAGKLKASAFEKGAAADDVKDRIIYDPTTGALYFDVDGTGSEAQVQFALLDLNLNLKADNFFVD